MAGLAGAHAAEAFAAIELSAGRPVGSGDAVELVIATGALPSGARVVVSTEAGTILGAVSPFPPGRPTGATIPVPIDAMAGDRLRVRLQVTKAGEPARAPAAGEIASVALIVR